MQWDEGPGAGFTEAAKPWLPLDRDHGRQNVATLTRVPDSILNLYRALIAQHHSHPAKKSNPNHMLAVTDATLVYERARGAERYIVALNLGGDTQPLPSLLAGVEIVLSTMMDRTGALDGAGLRGNEGLLLRPR